MVTDKVQLLDARSWQQICGERRFSVLLMILVVWLAVPPILLGFGMSAGWFDLLMSLLMFAAILSLCFDRDQRLFALLVGIPTILLSLGGHALPGEVGVWVLFCGYLCKMLFLFGAAGLIIKTLFNSKRLTFDCIFGAACGYVFLGLGWAVLYLMLEGHRPGSFAISHSLVAGDASAGPLPDALAYYSFVTLTTVGYGDICPVAPAARMFACIEAITGQFYLAVIVAGLVSILATRGKTEVSS